MSAPPKKTEKKQNWSCPQTYNPGYVPGLLQEQFLKLKITSTLAQTGFVFHVFQEMNLQENQYLVLFRIRQVPHVISWQQIQQHGADGRGLVHWWTLEYVQLDAVSHNDCSGYIAIVNSDDQTWWTFALTVEIHIIRLQQIKWITYMYLCVNHLNLLLHKYGI